MEVHGCHGRGRRCWAHALATKGVCTRGFLRCRRINGGGAAFCRAPLCCKSWHSQQCHEPLCFTQTARAVYCTMGTACFACITLAAGALDAYQTLQSVALQFDTCTAAVNRSCQPSIVGGGSSSKLRRLTRWPTAAGIHAPCARCHLATSVNRLDEMHGCGTPLASLVSACPPLTFIAERPEVCTST